MLLSFFWQVLGQFWRPASALAWLGPMYYYQPHAILQAPSGWPWHHLAALGGFGTLCWALAGWQFGRRDLRTL